VSIYSVQESSDERTDEELIEDRTPKGIKKINDLGVFGWTTFTSIFSYIWLYMCLVDGQVTPIEAWLTLSFFFVMIFIAYFLDLFGAWNQRRMTTKN